MEKIVKISGRVQGVGFRYWVVRQAEKIGNISGYAYNSAEGDVWVYMKGDEISLNKLEILLHKGPLFSRVDRVIEDKTLKPYFPEIKEGFFKRI